jgi:hypothetical protein
MMHCRVSSDLLVYKYGKLIVGNILKNDIIASTEKRVPHVQSKAF